MTIYRWNVAVLLIVFGVAAATAAVNYRINFYGLFGDVRGEKHIVYDNERTTKYLFGYNYIPRNFDGLLIGSSFSDNWDTGELSGIRMYNLSLNGANITEEAVIVEKVLQSSRPKLVLFFIHPYLTATSGRKSAYMHPQEYWGGFGSLQLFLAYAREWYIRHGYSRQEFNEFGRNDFIVPPQLRGQAPPVQMQEPFFIDERAIKEYRNLLERVRSSGARTVGIIPPIEMRTWKGMQTQFDGYCKAIEPLFREDEPIIDLNSPALNEFRSSPDNYQDGYHLSKMGAARIIQVVNNWLRQQGLLDPQPLSADVIKMR